MAETLHDTLVAKLNEWLASLNSSLDFELATKTNPKDLHGDIKSGKFQVLNIYRKYGPYAKSLLGYVIVYEIKGSMKALTAKTEEPYERRLRELVDKITPISPPDTQTEAPAQPTTQPSQPTSTPAPEIKRTTFIRFQGSPNIFARGTGKHIKGYEATSLGVFVAGAIEDILSPRPEVKTGADFAIWNDRDLSPEYVPYPPNPAPAASTPPATPPASNASLTPTPPQTSASGVLPAPPAPQPDSAYIPQYPTFDKSNPADIMKLGFVLYNEGGHVAEAKLGILGQRSQVWGVVPWHNLDGRYDVAKLPSFSDLQRMGVDINTSGGPAPGQTFDFFIDNQINQARAAAEQVARENVTRDLNAFIDRYRNTSTSIEIPKILNPDNRYVIYKGVFMQRSQLP